jgi:predicted membrane channel-forming protein YqfA (hemolysin III family)
MNPVFWTNAVVYILFIWSLFWKGLALWRAAHLKQRNWFVVMLVLNTVGILEIIYLFRFAKKRLTIDEMQSWKTIFFTKK